MPIKCVITDDEPFARKGLQSYIEKIEFLTLVGTCEDAVQLNSLLKQEPVDLLFLDIEMPYMTGIAFLKNYANPPKVIFTTAYEQYALQGFELDVLDYLLKPISFDRFLKACNRAFDYFQFRQQENDTFVFVKADNKLEKVLFNDILFVEAMENYVAIYTTERKIITHATLKMIQEMLPAGRFLQTHKSYIVNREAVKAIEGNLLRIQQYEVPVSKYQKEQVLEKIINNKMLKR